MSQDKGFCTNLTGIAMRAIGIRSTCLWLLAGSLVLGVNAQPQRQPQAVEAFRVQHFTAADGLPSNEVFAIEEDSLGFLWIGTGNGLVRYDGYTFETFLPQPGDSTSIGGRHISTLYVDATGDIWAGCGYAGPDGLSHFDRTTEHFRRYRHDPENPGNSLIQNEVTSIAASPDEPGILWIGTRDWPGQASGLSRLDVATGTFTHYTTEDGLNNNIVWELFVDRDGTLWVGTEGPGLNRFDPATNTFTSFFPTSPPSRRRNSL